MTRNTPCASLICKAGEEGVEIVPPVTANNQNEENTLSHEGKMNYCQRFIRWVGKVKRKHVDRRIMISGSLFVFAVVVIIIIVVIIKFLPGNLEQSQTDATPCPLEWTKNQETCFYFSGTENMWEFAKNNCSLSGGSLASISSKEELDFIWQARSPKEYWVNLRREKVEDPWQWPDGSPVSNWFRVGGKGLCGYLNEKAASSTHCNNTRSWICSKPVQFT